jgi:hypothetical protein
MVGGTRPPPWSGLSSWGTLGSTLGTGSWRGSWSGCSLTFSERSTFTFPCLVRELSNLVWFGAELLFG